MKTANSILEKHAEDYMESEQGMNPIIPLLAKKYILMAMEEYATEQVKNFNRLPNGSNLPVSGSEALRVALPVFKAILKGNCPRCQSQNWNPSKYDTHPDNLCNSCNYKFDNEFVIGNQETVEVILKKDFENRQ